MNKTFLKVIDYTIISTVFLLLFIFIILCILKLHVFFNSYNYLSKKIISGKETNIANISFYKFSPLFFYKLSPLF